MSCCILMTYSVSWTIKRFMIKFRKLKEAFEIKGLHVNIGKTKVIVSGGITKNGLSKSRVYPCGVCR